jgi:hypothetical protein
VLDERPGYLTRMTTPRDAILALLDQRPPEASICPSEAARVLGGGDFRSHMDEVREAAARLADEGVVEVTQGGRRVDIADARGPVRLRRAR